MGKYKQWLHHQEVGRRLREQIATHEQERERVQRMAPSHPTTLPDTNNPLVRALLDFTGRGGTLGRASGARLAGMPVGGSDADPQQRQPAEFVQAPAPVRPTMVPPIAPQPTAPTGASLVEQARAATTSAATGDSIAAQLQARAAEVPADPLEAMRALAQSQSRDAQGHSPAPSAPEPASAPTPTAPEGNTTGEWWQRFRTQS